MHILIAIVVITVIVLLLSRGVNEFEIKISNGKAAQVRGNILNTIVNDFSEAVSGVSKGSIIGRKSGKHVVLEFRGDIDEFVQQRCRNIYGLYNR